VTPRAHRPGRAFALALAVALTAHASEARAYCRTTTVPVTAGYDPASTGVCWTQGKPIAWPLGDRIGYELDRSASPQVDLAAFTTVADQAFTAWNTAACGSGDAGYPDIHVEFAGTVDSDVVTTDCGLIQCGPHVHDTHHVITFRGQSWNSTDPLSTLALTIVTFGATSGTIFDADTEINTSQWNISVADPLPPDAYDLRSILTHEAGHFLGLAHSQDSEAVMYALYHPGGAITLTPDDVDGICAIYGPSSGGSIGGGGGCALAAPPASSHAPVVLGGILLAAALIRRRRRCAR
jgi:hypothetical protein